MPKQGKSLRLHKPLLVVGTPQRLHAQIKAGTLNPRR